MPHIQLKIPTTEIKDSQDVFTLFVALNATGYNDENNHGGMSPIRKKVRARFREYDLKTEYPVIARTIKQHHPWYLLQKILTAKLLCSSRSFAAQIKKFSYEPVVKGLWGKTKTNRAKEAKEIVRIFRREVTQLIKFFNKTPQHLQKIILIANPLDAHWRGYSIKTKTTGYVVVGPGAKKNSGELIRHELLHLLTPSFRLPTDFVIPCPSNATASYVGYRVRNRECVVRALNLLYQKEILHTDTKPFIEQEKKYFPHIEKAIVFLEGKLKKTELLKK